MKKILTNLLLIISMIIYGQGIGSNPTMPAFHPVSPNAYQFTKYGNIPVSESTGTINLSIPLAKYSIGDINIPVSINYSGNAVKVRQMPTSTGINWNISAGGVITREVRGRPDEVAPEREHYSISYFDGLGERGNSFSGEWANTIYDMSHDNIADREVDIFNYSFPGYSGSFYLDADLKAHLIKYDKEIKIIFNYGSQIKGGEYFEIITPDGFKYYFGGSTASNVSKTRSTGSGSFFSVSYGDETQIAFFLNKIESPKGTVVRFEYQDENAMPQYASSIYIHKQGWAPDPVIQTDSVYVNDFEEDSSNIFNIYTLGPKIIRKIYSEQSSDSIIFQLDALDKMTQVKVYDFHGKNVKNIRFKYYSFANRGILKFFLKEIDFFPSNNNGNKYRFEYDRLDKLPKSNSYAIDYYGYYNGQDRNNSLIPAGYNSQIDQHYHNSTNRTPNSNFAKIGSLTKVIYPTGGISKFEYESGETNKTIVGNTSVYLEASANQAGYQDQDYPRNAQSYVISQFNQPFEIEMSSSASDITTGPQPFLELTIEDVTAHTSRLFVIGIGGHAHPAPQSTGDVEINQPSNGLDGHGTFSYDAISGHAYRFHLAIRIGLDSEPAIHNNNFDGTAIIHYKNSTNQHSEAPGLRIKRIITEKNADEPNNKKIIRYYYTSRDSVFMPTYVKPYTLKFIQRGKEKRCVSYPNSSYNRYSFINTTKLFSSSLIDAFMGDSKKNLYPYVTKSYGGDHFEKGGEELHFIVKRDSAIFKYFSSLDFYTTHNTNLSWENGTLIKKTLFKKDGKNFKNIKQIRYIYKIDQNKSSCIYNDIFQFEYPMCMLGTEGIISNVKLGIYKTYSFWHALDQIITKDYFDNDIVTSIQKYKYDSGLAGLPSEIISSTSESGKIYYTKTYYPKDVTLPNSLGNIHLTPNQMHAIDILKSQHRLIPIQVESGERDNQESVLSRTIKRNDFKFRVETETERVLLEKIQTAKGSNDLKDRIIYHQYDEYGNPTEISKADGTHIYYIWGYHHNQVIAKIVNFNYTTDKKFSNLVQAAIAASDADDDRTMNFIGHEGLLRQALQNIQHSNYINKAQMAFYTYDPLIGVTSITDPKGDTQYYIYDSMNRLQYIKDKDGHILKEYKYHYRITPQPIVSDGIDISNHSISNHTVTFSVSTSPSSGSGGGLTYEWSVLSGGTAVGTNTSDHFDVQYACSSNVQVNVQCTIRDVNFPDNNLTLSKQFIWNNCLSGGNLQVVSQNMDQLIFHISNLTGGNGNLTFKWYYDDLSDNAGYVLLGTTSLPDYSVSLPVNLCGKNIKAKCIITDNISGQQLNITNGIVYNFSCDVPPDPHPGHPH